MLYSPLAVDQGGPALEQELFQVEIIYVYGTRGAGASVCVCTCMQGAV